jgi:hypothetical protein
MKPGPTELAPYLEQMRALPFRQGRESGPFETPAAV